MTKVSIINLPNFDGEFKVEWVLSSVSNNVKVVDAWADGEPWKLSWMPEETVKLINKQLIEEHFEVELKESKLDAWDVELMSGCHPDIKLIAEEEAEWLEGKAEIAMGI